MAIENEGSRRIVVLIDADNAQVGKLRAIMAEIATHGHIIVKRAYGDWSSELLKNWKAELNLLAIQPIHQFSYTTGKNSTDIVMVIDAMDLLYTEKYDTFVLVSSDSDFTSLASRLRASEVYVFGIGEKKTPMAFRNACDDFLFTENLLILKKQIGESITVNDENNLSAEVVNSSEPPKKVENSLPTEIANSSEVPKKVENNLPTEIVNSSEVPKKVENNLPTEVINPRKFPKNFDGLIIIESPDIIDPIENIILLLDKACETFGDDEGWTFVANAGSYIKRSISGFNPKDYGFDKLTQLIKAKNDLYEMKEDQGKGNIIIHKYKKK